MPFSGAAQLAVAAVRAVGRASRSLWTLQLNGNTLGRLNVAYDLFFWRTATNSTADPKKIYAMLCEGELPSELEVIDANEMISQLRRSFPSWAAPHDETEWESPTPPRRGFQVDTSARHVHVRCQRLNDSELNDIIDAALAINCPLYDPQVDTRFDEPPKRTSSPERSAMALSAVVDDLGWVTCPGCARRFKTSDASVFLDGVHLKCLQRITLT